MQMSLRLRVANALITSMLLLPAHAQTIDENRQPDITRLLAAARAHNLEAMRAVLEAAADPNATDPQGRTVLGHVVRNHVQCHPGLEPVAARSTRTAQFLLAHGAHPSSPVLHDAVRTRCKALVVLLVEGGADVNAEIAGGLTPTQLAEDYGEADIAAYLRSKGGKVNLGYAIRRALDRFRLPYHSN